MLHHIIFITACA